MRLHDTSTFDRDFAPLFLNKRVCWEMQIIVERLIGP